MIARTSCRAFTHESVPDETIRAILTMAQRTASWCNSQSWQVAVTRRDGTERLRNALYAHAAEHEPTSTDFPFPAEYRGVHRDRRRESGFQLYNAVAIERGEKERQRAQMLENYRFFGAPHVAVLHVDEQLGPYGAVDCGAYVSTFLLAATTHGVATIAQAALAAYPDVLRTELGLSDDRKIVCGISFGYADSLHPVNGYRTSRADIDDVVDWIDR
nr:nitroreductase [Gordonia hydrophobica]